MDRGSLRSVPLRPPGDLDAALAAAVVAERLPRLDERERRAIVLVELLGAERARAAADLGLDEPALRELVWRARRALRRTLAPLPAGGWCERAERLLSDALDGALGPRDGALLRAHLAHCERCEEHERRLAQAREALVRACVERAAPPDAAPTAAPAELHLVEPREMQPAAGEPVAGEPVSDTPVTEEPAREPAAEEPAPEPAASDPAAREPAASEPAAPALAALAALAAEPGEPAAVRPADAVPAETAAALARVAVPGRLATVGLAQGGLAWTSLYALAVALAAFAVAVTLLAAAGSLERVL